MPNLRNSSKGGFEPGLTRLRVRHSTAVQPRSTCFILENYGPEFIFYFVPLNINAVNVFIPENYNTEFIFYFVLLT